MDIRRLAQTLLPREDSWYIEDSTNCFMEQVRNWFASDTDFVLKRDKCTPTQTYLWRCDASTGWPAVLSCPPRRASIASWSSARVEGLAKHPPQSGQLVPCRFNARIWPHIQYVTHQRGMDTVYCAWQTCACAIYLLRLGNVRVWLNMDPMSHLRSHDCRLNSFESPSY